MGILQFGDEPGFVIIPADTARLQSSPSTSPRLQPRRTNTVQVSGCSPGTVTLMRSPSTLHPLEGEEDGRNTKVRQPARRRSDMRVPVSRGSPLGYDLSRHALCPLKRRIPKTGPALRARGGHAPWSRGAPRGDCRQRTVNLSYRGRGLCRPGRPPPPLGELPEACTSIGRHSRRRSSRASTGSGRSSVSMLSGR